MRWRSSELWEFHQMSMLASPTCLLLQRDFPSGQLDLQFLQFINNSLSREAGEWVGHQGQYLQRLAPIGYCARRRAKVNVRCVSI